MQQGLLGMRRSWEGGTEVREEGGYNFYIYLSSHCHHQTVSCIKMGNDESHFNVSLMINCERRSHKTVSTNHKLTEEKEDPKWNRAEALLLTSLMPYR